MSAQNRPAARPLRLQELAEEDRPGLLERGLQALRPDEGWLGLPLVLTMGGAMAWSIANARWILGRDELTSFLIWMALAAGLWGYLSARLGVAPWLAHSTGAVIGAVAIIEAVGMVIPGAESTPFGWFHATAVSVVEAYLDLTWRHKAVTFQYGHFCLVLGIVVWGTAQAASYDVFGHHRSVNGVLLLSVVLIANMALTQNSDNQDQFVTLVVFSASALLLLLLAHAADERSSWDRHRIWRGRDFQAPHLQGGVAFAALAVAGALVLTTVASSAPLGSLADSLNLRDTFGFLEGLLPNGGNSRITQNSDFGPVSKIGSSFKAGNNLIFTVRLSSGSAAYHWRMVAYDEFQTTAWATGADTTDDQIIAGSTLDAGTLDLVTLTTPGRSQVTYVVHVQDGSVQHLIAANEPASVNVGATRTLLGGGTSSADVASFRSSASDYTVTALVPNIDFAGKSGLTEWNLRQAGTDYPAGLRERYMQGTDLVGAQGKQLLADIKAWALTQNNAFDTEYDVAKAMQTYLHSARFTYNTDISSQMASCTGPSTVDCFATIKQGFCEQYATTMTMLMRMQGYPARYVQGYLPGPVDQTSLVQQVTAKQSHAWVEVYFPTYGWITFDPTGGPGQPTVLPAGTKSTASPSPSAPSDNSADRTARPSKTQYEGSSGTPAGSTGGPPALLVWPLLLVVVTVPVLLLWRRRPRRLDEPDVVYRGVIRLASRLGYKPGPTQTVYEYTGMLAGVVPKAKESLAVVATAAVEVTYGRRVMGVTRLAQLSSAEGAVRKALLRLLLRLPRVRRHPGPKRPGSTGVGPSRPNR